MLSAIIISLIIVSSENCVPRLPWSLFTLSATNHQSTVLSLQPCDLCSTTKLEKTRQQIKSEHFHREREKGGEWDSECVQLQQQTLYIFRRFFRLLQFEYFVWRILSLYLSICRMWYPFELRLMLCKYHMCVWVEHFFSSPPWNTCAMVQ